MFFDLVFLAGHGHEFRVQRHRLDALDVVGRAPGASRHSLSMKGALAWDNPAISRHLGLSHAKLTSVEWWCERGQVTLYARLLDRFACSDKLVDLSTANDCDSSLSHGFDFKRLVARTLVLLGSVTLDTSRPGKERVSCGVLS